MRIIAIVMLDPHLKKTCTNWFKYFKNKAKYERIQFY